VFGSEKWLKSIFKGNDMVEKLSPEHVNSHVKSSRYMYIYELNSKDKAFPLLPYLTIVS